MLEQDLLPNWLQPAPSDADLKPFVGTPFPLGQLLVVLPITLAIFEHVMMLTDSTAFDG
jgi:hypothetical protein